MIGRSSSCSLALEDGLVSRRHAVLHVAPSELQLEDLGSRNGVAVNGSRVKGRCALRHLDRVQIGSQELLVLEAEKKDAAATLQLMNCWKCGQLNDHVKGRCSNCSAILGVEAATVAGGRATIEVTPANIPTDGVLPDHDESLFDEQTTVGSSFHLLKTIADKALAMGRFDEAERILAKSLAGVKSEAKRNGRLDPRTRLDGTEFALRLMMGPKAESWMAWVLELHTDVDVVLEKTSIAALHVTARRMKAPPTRHLESYLHTLSKGTRTPAERFRIKQLEGLLRVLQA